MLKVSKAGECRFCGGELSDSILELGAIFPSNFSINEPDPQDKVPMTLVECVSCGLTQMEDTVDREDLYRQYWYESGLNDSMVEDLRDIVNHVKTYVKNGGYVLDIGANDGTMLGMYPDNIVTVGIDPAKNLESVARRNCDYFVSDFFPPKLPFYPGLFSAVTAIAMFYDLEDVSAFMENIVKILTKDGIFVVQFTDLTTTLRINAIDNVVHEHLEYYTLGVVSRIFRKFGLEIIETSYNEVNGGSLRVTAARFGEYEPSMDFHEHMYKESEYLKVDNLLMLQDRVEDFRIRLVNYISDRSVAVMAASTKGNTLLQVFGIDHTMIDHAAEINPGKFGLKTVGTGIPIISEEESLTSRRPDYYLVLAWHFAENLIAKHTDYLESGGVFIFPLPVPRICFYLDDELVWENI